jgi:predicted transcriptional regulator of viral defense system
MSGVFAKKLDLVALFPGTDTIRKGAASRRSRRTAKLIRKRIERGGERLWRLEDFHGLPSAAVAQALSRLTRQGILERLSNGTYYRPRRTTFGKSVPNPSTIQKLASRRKAVLPSGISAANLLRFTTQTTRRREVSIRKRPRRT